VRKVLLTLILLALAAFTWRMYAPIKRAPGVLADREPEQTLLRPPLAPISKEGWTLQPVAVFSIDARVLGVKRYSNDLTAKLAPCDLVLGWGPMSDTAVLERLDITQYDRFYRWRFWGTPPVTQKEIETHSANMHIIAADDSIQRKVDGLRLGSLVHLSGNLVVATHPKAKDAWRTSLSRDDKGEGACEIFYVKSLEER
jgi:hypothetical protein